MTQTFDLFCIKQINGFYLIVLKKKFFYINYDNIKINLLGKKLKCIIKICSEKFTIKT